jgi:hypothetical protein
MINWSIISLESFQDTGIVVSANWKCSNEQVSKTGHSVFNLDFLNPTQPSIIVTNNEEGTSEEIVIEEVVSEEINIEQPSDIVKDIIPYNELTEEIVLNWVWVDGGVDKTLVEESIAQELQGLINPTIIKNPLPWA